MTKLTMEMTMNGKDTPGKHETPFCSPIACVSGVMPPVVRRSELIGAVSWRIACSVLEVRVAGEEAADVFPTAPHAMTTV